MNAILNRLKEPSTWAGIAGVMAGVGLFGLTEDQWMQVGGAIAAVAGVIAMLVSEKGVAK